MARLGHYRERQADLGSLTEQLPPRRRLVDIESKMQRRNILRSITPVIAGAGLFAAGRQPVMIPGASAAAVWPSIQRRSCSP